jgi:DNA-binding MarR family transcriptional regulator
MSPARSTRRIAPTGAPTKAFELTEEVAPVFNSLRRQVHALHAVSREVERRLDLTGAQLFVLAQLGATPSLSITDLAARTMTHQSTVSVVVRRLVRRKLVRKVRSVDDGRRVELTLTPTGRALLGRAPTSMQVRLALAVQALSPAVRRGLGRNLTALVAAIGADQAPVPMFFERRARD